VQANIFKNFADDRIYDAIKVVLDSNYPNDVEKVECIMKHMRENNVADKFYTVELLTNQEKLSQEIQPYVDNAVSSCGSYLKKIKDFFRKTYIKVKELIGWD
jgi:hypothetical protein